MLQTHIPKVLHCQRRGIRPVRMSCEFRSCAAFVFFLAVFALYSIDALAEVYEWEYIDPSNPALGKQESNTLVPDGATADPLDYPLGLVTRNLTKGYLAGSNLREFRLGRAILDDAYLVDADMYRVSGEISAKNADFSGTSMVGVRFSKSDLSMATLANANLTDALLDNSILAGTDFTDSILVGAELSSTTAQGFTAAQLYSSASYKSKDLSNIRLGQNDLQGWDFSNQQLNGAYFGSTQLTGAVFTNATIKDARFSDSDLTSAQLYSTASYANRNLGGIFLVIQDLSGWDFSQQSMEGAVLDRSILTNANFYGADLSLARITEAVLSGATFDDAELRNALIGGGQFNLQSDVSFRGTNLTNAIFDTNGRWERADFTGANLEGARLSNNGFVNSIFTDAIVRGAELESVANFGFTLQNLYSTASYQSGDLRNIQMRYGDLTGANFAGIDLSGASLFEVDLEGADFRGANLTGAGIGTALNGADFRGANLTNASLSYNSVTSIDFRGADLSGASLLNASHKNADFTDAIIFGAKLSAEYSPKDLTAEQLYSTASYKQGSLGPVVLAGEMQGWDFRNQDLTGALFSRDSKLQAALWDGAKLDDTQFFVNSLQNADFRNADLHNVNFTSCDLSGADFSGNDLTGARINGDLTGTNFQGAKLENVGLGGNLTNANFTGADLRHAAISASSFSGAIFTDADVRHTGLDHATDDGFTLAQLMSTRSYQDRDLTSFFSEGNEFPNADFSNFEMSESDFRSANLSNASFASTNLTRVSFYYAILSGADFTDATIHGASFRYAVGEGFTKEQLYSSRSYQQADLREINLQNNILSGWNFQNMNLTGASFVDSDLTGADFAGAVIEGANFSNTPASNSASVGITQAQLVSTASFQQRTLVGVNLSYADLSGLDLSGFDLRGIDLTSTKLNAADFTDSQITGAALWNTTAGGFTAQQLYSTANFQLKDLRGVNFGTNTMSGWNLQDQNLQGAYFDRNPQGTNILFQRADLRGVRILSHILGSSETTNAILPDGKVRGLNLTGPVRMLIRNFDPISRSGYPISRPPLSPDNDDPISILVDTSFSIDQDATLEIEFSDQPWISTISFQADTPVNLDGTLELTFAEGTDPRSQIGEIFQVFNWTGVDPLGQFHTVGSNTSDMPQLTWDLSKLYSDGTVQLVAVVPEPAAVMLLLAGLMLTPLLVRP